MPPMRLKPVSWDTSPVRLGKDPVTIGRHPRNVIRLKDEKASRFHCVIEADDNGGYQIRDLESRNGTRVNGDLIESRPLRAGDQIAIGRTEFVLEALEDEGEGAPADGRAAPRARRREGTPKGGSPAWAREMETLYRKLMRREEEEEIGLIDARGTERRTLKGSGDGPRAGSLLLNVASAAVATDIHLEPRQETMLVRMRVDGQMVSITELPRRVGELFGGLVKAACHMKQASADSVQEGHFGTRFPDRRVDYRASFTPSVHGQKLVLRVLDMRNVPTSLTELGLAPYMHQRVRRVCEQDHGLLLVCGPTGSGKTTTLYNVLREIDRDSKNVVTIEDPVEYRLEGVTQIPIADHRGNTFGSLLRSVLRQDPDVILVGEIRDDETARTAMQAAMTGHVVLSTVHANNSIAAVFRLLDLKVEPYLVANGLDMVLAQRLVRRLCETCRREIPVKPGVATRLGKFLQGRTTMHMAVGCERCLKTGYKGRRAIFELLDVTDELRDVILSEPSIQAMRAVIREGMFTTLAQSGWKLVAEGLTTLEEVDKVAGQG